MTGEHLGGDFAWVDIPTVTDNRGSLSYAESGDLTPFDIKRVYYIHGAPTGALRGRHAHRELQQVMVAVHGSCYVAVDDTENRHIVKLDDPTTGLYVPPMAWREMLAWNDECVLLVLASEHHDPDDYIDDYEEFNHELRNDDPTT